MFDEPSRHFLDLWDSMIATIGPALRPGFGKRRVRRRAPSSAAAIMRAMFGDDESCCSARLNTCRAT